MSFFARKRGSVLILILYSLHAFSLIALFTGILACFFVDVNAIPDWCIGLGGIVLFVKDISLFYSLKNKPRLNLQRPIEQTTVTIIHRLILLSASIVIMVVLWEKSLELRANTYDAIGQVALAVLYTFLYCATRIPSIVVDICESRPRKMISMIIGYIVVLIFQVLMLY